MKRLPQIAAALLCASPLFAADELLEKANQIQKRILAFDCHLDLTDDYPGAAEDGKTQFDLPKAARGHLKGGSIAVWVPIELRNPEGLAKGHAAAIRKYEMIKAVAEANPSLASIAYSPSEVKAIAAQGKFAVVISMLDTFHLGQDPAQLDEWYKRGVRIIGYTQSGHNDWADSSRPKDRVKDKPAEHGGLSELGEKASRASMSSAS